MLLTSFVQPQQNFSLITSVFIPTFWNLICRRVQSCSSYIPNLYPFQTFIYIAVRDVVLPFIPTFQTFILPFSIFIRHFQPSFNLHSHISKPSFPHSKPSFAHSKLSFKVDEVYIYHNGSLRSRPRIPPFYISFLFGLFFPRLLLPTSVFEKPSHILHRQYPRPTFS